MKNRIIKIVSDQLQIDLISTAKHRKRNYVYARAIYYRITRDLTVESLADIGKPLKKNHATVVHALNNVFTSIESYEPDMFDVYKACKEIALQEIRLQKDGVSAGARKSISELSKTNKILTAEVESLNKELEHAKSMLTAQEPIVSEMIARVPEKNKELFIERLDAMTKMLTR